MNIGGRRLTAVLLVTLTVALAGCGGDDDEAGGETTATTPPTMTGGTGAGEEVFASAGCGTCHILAAAGANGTTGPNLDELQPSAEEVERQVTNGGGGMPAFKDQLSEQEITDVAAYVAESAGQ
jgi:mono/diheme cytochrome c family protein